MRSTSVRSLLSLVVAVAAVACSSEEGVADLAVTLDLAEGDLAVGPPDLQQPSAQMYDFAGADGYPPGVCNGLIDDAPEAVVQQDLPVASVPLAMGGAINPGVYNATKVQYFGGPGPATSFRGVRVFTATTTDLTIQLNMTAPTTESRSYSVVGTDLVQKPLCPIGAELTTPYTATPTEIATQTPLSASSALVITWTRR